jgi:hypothetical protein
MMFSELLNESKEKLFGHILAVARIIAMLNA